MKSMSIRIRENEGSAFVISILVLFVLSVLGLALMLTTSTEKDIAVNYRWGEQAFFNADAALEYGKNVLASYAVVNANFLNVLPPPRANAIVPSDTDLWGTALPVDPLACIPTAPGCRDNQYYVDQCPAQPQPPLPNTCVRIYIGRVLLRPDATPAQWDFRAPAGVVGDLDNDGTSDLEGTFTLWVRRPTVGSRDYGSLAGEEDRVILTAEGTAPNDAGAGAGRPTSLRRLEMTVRLPPGGMSGSKYDDSSNASDTSAASAGYGAQQTLSSGVP